MEREVIGSVVAPELPVDEPETGAEAYPPAVEARVVAYLSSLGIKDPGLIRRLCEACLQRASRRAAPGADEELLRRALEEAQRRFDAALAHSLNLAGVKNQHALAAARAALLLGDGKASSERFMQVQEGEDATLTALAAVTPLATPPEVPQTMHEQPISFVFRRS